MVPLQNIFVLLGALNISISGSEMFSFHPFYCHPFLGICEGWNADFVQQWDGWEGRNGRAKANKKEEGIANLRPQPMIHLNCRYAAGNRKGRIWLRLAWGIIIGEEWGKWQSKEGWEFHLRKFSNRMARGSQFAFPPFFYMEWAGNNNFWMKGNQPLPARNIKF